MKIAAFVLGLTLTGSLAGQAPAGSLTRRYLPRGMSVELPTSWQPLSDSMQVKVTRMRDTVLEHTSNPLIQASLKNGKPISLLHERAPGQAGPSANLNVAPAPGAVPALFDAATPEQVAASLAPLCGAMEQVMARLGAKVVTCDPAFIDRAAGRTIAVTRLVRSGPDGFATVWLAQYPDKDAVYTLTLSAPQAEESRYEPLFRRIWRSMEIPEVW